MSTDKLRTKKFKLINHVVRLIEVNHKRYVLAYIIIYYKKTHTLKQTRRGLLICNGGKNPIEESIIKLWNVFGQQIADLGIEVRKLVWRKFIAQRGE